MDIQVLEGSFVEVPTAEVNGMNRRAFGEFVGPRGELALYAFGWTTGRSSTSPDWIGVGNPARSTRWCSSTRTATRSLTDERFEQVPFARQSSHAD